MVYFLSFLFLFAAPLGTNVATRSGMHGRCAFKTTRFRGGASAMQSAILERNVRRIITWLQIIYRLPWVFEPKLVSSSERRMFNRRKGQHPCLKLRAVRPSIFVGLRVTKPSFVFCIEVLHDKKTLSV